MGRRAASESHAGSNGGRWRAREAIREANRGDTAIGSRADCSAARSAARGSLARSVRALESYVRAEKWRVQLAEKAPCERMPGVLEENVLVEIDGGLKASLQVERSGGDETCGERRGMELEGGVTETNQLINAFLGESMLKKGRGNGQKTGLELATCRTGEIRFELMDSVLVVTLLIFVERNLPMDEPPARKLS